MVLCHTSSLNSGGGAGRSTRLAARQTDARRVTGKCDITQAVGVVVPGVARRIQRRKLQAGDLDHVAVLHGRHLFRRCGDRLAPQCIHAGRRRCALALESRRVGINQVRRADFVHVDLRSFLRQPAGCAGMVKMNMCDQDMPDIVRGEAVFAPAAARKVGSVDAGPVSTRT